MQGKTNSKPFIEKVFTDKITITKPGKYVPTSDYIGFDEVNVNIPLINNQNLNINKNGTYTADDGYTGLGTVTVNVPTSGGTASKYGATLDSLLGDVDENGVLQKPTASTVLNFAGIIEVGSYALYGKFYNSTGITNVDLSSIITVGNYGMYSAFYDCSGIISINLNSLTNVDDHGMSDAFYRCTGITGVLDLSSLITVGYRGMYNAFYGCKNITRVDLSSLQNVDTYGLYNAFYDSTGITSIDLRSLTTIGSSGMYYAFANTNLTTISFQSLISVQTNSFGSAPFNYAFNFCTALTEIHFRSDMQEIISTLDGYADKWGATNATIYFDL